jgi:hypothetical protein
MVEPIAVLILMCMCVVVIGMGVGAYFYFNRKVDCVLSDWSSCVGGFQTRTIKTKPENGGKACEALTKTCSTPASPGSTPSPTPPSPTPARNPKIANIAKWKENSIHSRRSGESDDAWALRIYMAISGKNDPERKEIGGGVNTIASSLSVNNKPIPEITQEIATEICKSPCYWFWNDTNKTGYCQTCLSPEEREKAIKQSAGL